VVPMDLLQCSFTCVTPALRYTGGGAIAISVNVLEPAATAIVDDAGDGWVGDLCPVSSS